MRKKCLFSELFWTVFSHIRTKYAEIRSVSPYSVSVRIESERGKIRTRITPNTDTLPAVKLFHQSKDFSRSTEHFNNSRPLSEMGDTPYRLCIQGIRLQFQLRVYKKNNDALFLPSILFQEIKTMCYKKIISTFKIK